jgi:hypothetical protein
VIELKSLDLKVQGDEASGYTAEAVGPAGERASGPFNWTSIAHLGADLQAIEEGMADRKMLERIGLTLFQALFPMDVMMVYVAIKAQLGEGEGLRLRLHLPPTLARLPWELLYYPPFYLTTDPRSPVVRFLDLPTTPRPLAVEPPLRLLHLVAGPVDAPSLDTDGEAAQLHSALADLMARGGVEILPARPGTLATLREGVRQGAQVLHFSGHGGFAGDQGYLLFEEEDRHGRPVKGDTLAHLLRGSKVRLAVLNACQSALAGGSDAFSSVAGSLVRAGLPAVIAHQYTVPDNSAIAFAADVYRALAAGFPVDAAVSEGRKAILSELGTTWRDRVDWATPALYMNAPDGHVFDLEGAQETAASAYPAMPVIHQQVFAQDDAATIGTITGGTVQIDLGGSTSGGRPTASPRPADPLPGLLDQLRRTVRDYAPQDRQAQALEKVAALRGAAAEKRPNLTLLEAVLRWFEAELPSLSGAVLSAILRFESRAEQAGDEVLLEFRRRFSRL